MMTPAITARLHLGECGAMCWRCSGAGELGPRQIGLSPQQLLKELVQTSPAIGHLGVKNRYIILYEIMIISVFEIMKLYY